MSMDGGDEYPDVWDESVRRARKEHTCGACKEPIKRGHLYSRTACLYEGSWDFWNRCARCEAIYRFLKPLVRDLGEEDGFECEQYCDPALNCGHTFQDNFKRDAPLAVQALAFLKPEEAQLLLSAPKVNGESEEERIERVLASILTRAA